MKKLWKSVGVALLILATLAGILNDISNDRSVSKAAIVTEIKAIEAKLGQAEANSGTMLSSGVRVYSAAETGRLLALYQQLQERVDRLQTGRSGSVASRWRDVPIHDGSGTYFGVAEVERALREFKAPAGLLQGLRIYLLPGTMPGISGMGQASYNLLAAESASSLTSVVQLRVTLYHEIGHHVHMTYMPTSEQAGRELWRSYLARRGGKWHGPGAANSGAWGASSEETFAEDFRMLFGTDQPYYGDLDLGDIRETPARAAAVKRFMTGLAGGARRESYRSPWLPPEIGFWTVQPWLIAGMWLGLAGGIIWTRRSGDEPSRADSGAIVAPGL
jgi:hypothetical protein